MNSHEAFYVHVHGEQKGPYTIRHLDHLLNSGLIPVETLYWTEGLEQWLPITELIPLRKKPRIWRKLAWSGGALTIVGILTLLFGSTIADGWRENTQREYTVTGAYWSARGAVRSSGVPSGKLVQFAPESESPVTLVPPDSADVLVHGNLSGGGGGGGTKTSWKVHLSFNSLRCEWSASDVKVISE
jgi:hypothetical protein